jgi:peptidoglycan hydrolase-like protein with peptidoglycan-binding domain
VTSGIILGLYALSRVSHIEQPQPSETSKWRTTSSSSSSPYPVIDLSPPDRPLTADEIREAQTQLKAAGFDAGVADGIVGPRTIEAIKRYEAARGWSISGDADLRLLNALRASKPSYPYPAPPSSSATPPTATPDMQLATRVIRAAEHPCPVVTAATRLSEGSLLATCSNGDIYRVMQFRGEWLALNCSAAQRHGIQGC